MNPYYKELIGRCTSTDPAFGIRTRRFFTPSIVHDDIPPTKTRLGL